VITLVLGGARSGKSAVAEAYAGRLPQPVTYVATARVDADDADWVARVERHRARRDPTWTTVDAGDGRLPQVLEQVEGTALVDSLGTWVSGAEGFAVDGVALIGALRGRTGDTVLVSEEVGLGVHPSSELGRRFRDVLGELNHLVAEVADDAVLVVAGRVLPLLRP
jgi:adenosyl cobinamide kinase/adenosyl cobinamide phosphate guanylyltransferase